jgi:hypothetical protein
MFARSLIVALVLVAGSVGVVPNAAADEPVKLAERAKAANELTFKIDSVSIFKDGYALISKSATATVGADGTVFTHEVPDTAVLGCFWALAEDGTPVRLTAEYMERDSKQAATRTAASIAELLRSNVGKHVTLDVADRAESVRSVQGTVTAVLGGSDATATSEATPGSLVVVDSRSNGSIVLPIASVIGLTSFELKTDIATPATKERVKVLRAALGQQHAGKPAKLQMFYFAKGMRWVPTYRLHEPDASKAQLVLHGEIVNELEDVSGAKVGLVAGVPNFRFKGEVSSLSLEAALRDVLPVYGETGGRTRSESRRLLGQQLSNSAYFRDIAEPGSEAPGGGGLSGIEGEGAQDLYVYEAGTLDLKKGGRMSVPLWQVDTTTRHVYTVEVTRGPTDANELQYWNQYREQTRDEDLMAMTKDGRVWHQVELENKSDAPWTTGAALVVQKELPISQDVLTYTPRNGRSRVPLTVATEVRAMYDEVEVSRDPQALQWNNSTYAQIRKKATFTVTNFRSEKTTLIAKASVIGKVGEVSDGGTATAADMEFFNYGSDLRALNSRGNVCWELTLEPGEKRVLTMEYSVYVR